LKKVNKKWYHELKRATTTIKTKVAKVRAKPKTIGTAEVNATNTVTLPRQRHLSDKLSVLFELCHARQMCSHFKTLNQNAKTQS